MVSSIFVIDCPASRAINPTIQQSNNPTIEQSNNPTIQQSNNPTIQQSMKQSIHQKTLYWLLFFGTAASIVVLAAYLVNSTVYLQDHNIMSFAVTADLALTIPIVYYFLVVRTQKMPWASTLVVYLASVLVYADEVVAANWDSLVFDTGTELLRRAPMMEPSRGTEAHVGRLIKDSETSADLLERLGS